VLDVKAYWLLIQKRALQAVGVGKGRPGWQGRCEIGRVGGIWLCRVARTQVSPEQVFVKAKMAAEAVSVQMHPIDSHSALN
jgi:hypothetical protein